MSNQRRTAPTPPEKKKTPHAKQPFLRKIRRNRLWLLLYLWSALAIPELVLHWQTSTGAGTLLGAGLVLPPLFALVPGLVVFLLCTVLPKPGGNFLLSVLYATLSLALCGAQMAWYARFGIFFHVRDLGNTEALSALLTGAGACLPQLLLMALPLILLLVMGRKVFSFKPIRRVPAHLLTICLCIGAQLGLATLLPVFGTAGDHTAYGLYHHAGDPYYSVNRLGAFTALRLELFRQASGTTVTGSVVLEPTLPPETTVPRESEAVKESTEPVENVLEIDFDALWRSESDPAIAEVHRYFGARAPSMTNEQTGLFTGCNLILISVEDFDPQTVSETQSPALWALFQEGYRFSRYYAPDWGSEGEYALLTGTIPQNGGDSFQAVVGNRMPLTLSQQLIQSGYCAYAYDGFRDREYFFENLGYEYHHYGDGTISAVELVDLSAQDYVNYPPFTVYYSTTASHLEDAVSLLMARLKAAGQLENTVIVLVPGGVAAQDPALCESSCVIWKAGLRAAVMEEPCSMLDLLPTLTNLLGLEFDSRLYMGRDVFSTETPLVIFPDRSWIWGGTVYHAAQGTFTGDPLSKEAANAIHTEVSNRFTVSARILAYDYWRLFLNFS